MALFETDTIVAVATPLGASDRAICRLSGPDAVPTAQRLFEPADAFPHDTATYLAVPGHVCLNLRPVAFPPRPLPPAPRPLTPDPRPLIPALLSRVPATLYLMRAPRSYTREDVAELHVPGSAPVVSALVGALVETGARPAGPGEFTRRAFLNGRIDLAQAEAVLGVIRAADDEALRSALAGLGAAAGRRIRALAADLDQLAALVELGIDFSEEDLDPVPPAELADRLNAAVAALAALAAEPAGSEIPPAEPAVALVGPPNSGKSSLFNALVGRARSIVSHVAGTTRDVITAPLTVGSWRLLLADTAGGPAADDSLAAAAWAAARKQAGASHLLLVVIDRNQPLTPDVRRSLDEVVGSAPTVIVLNKSDLPARTTVDEVARWRPSAPVVETSALTSEGLGGLRSALAGAFASARVRVGSEGLLLPARQARAAALALRALRRAETLLTAGDSPELVALEVRAAREYLASITGRGITAGTSSDTVLDLIFSQFCVGK